MTKQNKVFEIWIRHGDNLFTMFRPNEATINIDFIDKDKENNELIGGRRIKIEWEEGMKYLLPPLNDKRIKKPHTMIKHLLKKYVGD